MVSVVEMKESSVEMLVSLIRLILNEDWCLCGAITVNTGERESSYAFFI